MKQLTNSFFTKINSEQLKKLSTLVTETIAIDTSNINDKTFTSVDLWKIQRAKKPVRKVRFA